MLIDTVLSHYHTITASSLNQMTLQAFFVDWKEFSGLCFWRYSQKTFFGSFTKTEIYTKATKIHVALSQRDSVGENDEEEELEAHAALITVGQEPH